MSDGGRYQRFDRGDEKVFVSDGSSAIEEMQQKWFGNFTSVLDIMHALSYSLAAARAIYRDQTDSWECYRRFAWLIWQGNVDAVIAELGEHQKALGDPPADREFTTATSPISNRPICAQRLSLLKHRLNGFGLKIGRVRPSLTHLRTPNACEIKGQLVPRIQRIRSAKPRI